MATYGVGVANKFDLLDDEDHPTTKVVKEEKAKPQQTKTKPVVSEKPAEEPKTARTKVDDRQKLGGSQRGRGGKTSFGGRGGRPPRPGKRQFDRRGGPDSYEKGQPRKGGLGLGSETEVPAEESTEQTESTEQQPEVEKEKVVEQVKDDKLSYEQFLEQQKAKLVEDDNKIAPRAVIIDEKLFKKAVVLKSEKQKDESNKQEHDDEDGDKKSRKTISLDEFVSDVKGGNRGFSGRGRGGRFSGRGGRRVDVNDDSEFPTLGGK